MSEPTKEQVASWTEWGLCPKCGSELGQGYGLAGGGIGAYTYCTDDDCDYFDKVQDPPEDDHG
jgi:hypothetical protein